MTVVNSYLGKVMIFCSITCSSLLISCGKNNHGLDFVFSEVTLNDEKFPDFSFAGYKNSEIQIPKYPVAIILEAITGDNFTQIQSAIDQLSSQPLKNGVRGAILLKAGTYDISKTLVIAESGIVIRGEGQGDDGTIVNITSTYNFSRIASLKQTAALKIEGKNIQPDFYGNKKLVLKDVEVGASKIIVEDAASFDVGDTVEIIRKTNQEWIDLLGMAQYGWTPSQYEISHKRIINSITDDTLGLNIPLVDKISVKFGGGEVVKVRSPQRLNNSGVENLKITSVFISEDDENHAWNAVMLTNTEHCWVRNMTAEHFAFAAVALSQSSNITVQDCAILNFKSKAIGDRRYSFAIEHGSSNNLIQRCYSEGGRHDFVTGSKVPGPNVFLDCVAVHSSSDTGPHHRWATGTLYDNIKANKINAKNSKGGGSGHGWTGAFNMFWNNNALEGFIIQSPPSAENWLIGAKGAISHDSNGYIINSGTNVLPRSLFIEQLRKRVGQSRLNDIIIPEQNANIAIWNKLENWRGKSTPLKKI